MSEASDLIAAGFAVLAALSAVVSLVGMAISEDIYAKLLYGSIPCGATALLVACGVAFAFGPGIETFQMVAFVLLMAVSGGVTGHRIAAAAAHRKARQENGE